MLAEQTERHRRTAERPGRQGGAHRSTSIRCPSCGQAYRLPEAAIRARKRLRCARCSKTFLPPSREGRTYGSQARRPTATQAPAPRRAAGPVHQGRITVWHWLSALIVLGCTIGAIVFVIS